jgi:S1-C subfamily serine protease
MIRGTVTIWVDRGIRVQQGMGFADRVIGSGFFIDKRGYIVTNHHVISSEVDPTYEGYSRLYIKMSDDPDTRIPARVVGWDPVFDLALLKTEVEPPYVFSLGSSTDIGVGDRIYAIGSPVGLDSTLTSGIVSAVNRKLFSLGGVLQIDAAINSGNSGGPIIDQDGAVQAIVFAGIEPYEGLNFAIPVEYLLLELNRLHEGGKVSHGWTGSFGNTRRDARAEVLYVMPGGSSSLAGLKPGEVIIAVDGEAVSSIEEVQRRLLVRMPGTIVRFTCVPPEGEMSSAEASERFIYLEQRPQNPGFDIYQRDLPENYFLPLFGMTLVQTSMGLKKNYRVTSVIQGGVADESGFSVEDPFQLERVRISPEEDAIMAEIYAKKRKNMFINVWLAIGAYLDSPGYF